MRHDVSLLAIAPLTSMYFAGKSLAAARRLPAGRSTIPTAFRATGKGERIWRPLGNPSALAVSSFSDNNPRGFGLMQRERALRRSTRTATRGSRRRPSLWVEPIGDWGDGEVRLVEIPTKAETNDNIVGLLGAALASQAGRAGWSISYRLSALDRRRGAVAAGARRGDARRCGSGQCTRRAASSSSSPAASSPRCSRNNRSSRRSRLSSGKLLRSYVEALPWQKSWRLFIDFEPDGKKPVDMRAFADAARQGR